MLLAEVPSNPVFNLAPWVVFLPAIGLVLNLLIGRRLGEIGAGLIACLAVIGSFAVSVVMMLVVSGVGALIHIYAVGYMHADVRHNGDPGRFTRFFVYLNLFIAMMMILVTADNFLMLFVGWEGVGLCSYLLIGFWFEKGAGGIANAKAAKKAFVANRVGDFGLLIALFIIFATFGSFDFNTVFAGVAKAAPATLVAITLFMLLGVTGKSAQIPLYVWLPDAMAGPTPVSALIHAATIVTAGVYLVTRSSVLYMATPVAQSTVTWVGALTALLAATIAVGQYDIKKVLAYSTISQLGFMVAAVGMGAYTAGIFHLVTHAFFKALLFLGAGSVILGMEHGHEHSTGGHAHAAEHGHAEEDFDPQDMRNMGGLCERMPLTFWVYLVGALALAGIAPLAGFFSKDEILAAASQNSPAVFVILILAAFLTAFYVCRQLLMVFFGKERSPAAGHAVESPAIVTVPLVVLALGAALGGLLNFPGLHTLETWLEPVLKEPSPVGFMPAIAGASLGVALLGLLLAWLFYSQRKHTPVPGEVDPLGTTWLKPLFHAFERKWWVDEIYQAIILTPYTEISRFMAENFDQGFIDGIVNGVGWLAAGLARLWGTLQNGFVRRYALSIVAGVVVILAYLLLR